MNKQRTILIVDDEEMIRSLVARVLEDDYNCQTACDGNEAVDLLGQNDFDVVITDLNMPGMNGFDLCKLIFTDYPKIAVIIVTGFPELLEEAESTRLSIFCVPKPFTTNQLRQAVASALDSRDAYEARLRFLQESSDNGCRLTLE